MPSALSPREISKILKQTQTGDITSITKLQLQDPRFHWSTLRYADTGDSVLHCAARWGHLNTLAYLLSYAPSGIECKNKDDKTALHEAAQFSHDKAIQLLIEKGARVNALKRADWTPLMLACTKRCLNSIKLLVESGGLINYRNKDGWSCMHLAAREGSAEIFRYLLEKGGDLRVRTKNGRSVLHVAALHAHLNIVEILLNGSCEDVNAKDNCGNTPLHEAVLGQDVNICKYLIENGADLKCTNDVDFNLLHLASSVGYNNMIVFIVEDLKFDVNSVNLSGLSALHCAARNSLYDTYQDLLRLGCNENVRDKFGRVAFDYFK